MHQDLNCSSSEVAARLIALYDEPAGGKARGRYRISMKLMRRMFGQRRIWPEQIEAIRRELYERGYLLVDMETFFAVVSQKTFVSYRRINETGLTRALSKIDASGKTAIAGG